MAEQALAPTAEHPKGRYCPLCGSGALPGSRFDYDGILLLVAAGVPKVDIAAQMGCSRQTVYDVIERARA